LGSHFALVDLSVKNTRQLGRKVRQGRLYKPFCLWTPPGGK
jgi:hypothetical protein